MLALTYHSISDGPPPLCIPPERFAAQLDFLLAAGFEAVAAQDAAAGAVRGRRRFAITFDDGYRDFREHALPILEARGLPATLFAVASENREQLAGGIDAPLLGWRELAELAARGVSIGAHGVSHRDLTALADEDVELELREGRRLLEQSCACEIESFAYPFGAFDDRVRAAALRHYESAWTTQLAALPRHPDPGALPRVDAYYLDSRSLRWLLTRGRPEPYLGVRRWLRRIRGSEPREPIRHAGRRRTNVAP